MKGQNMGKINNNLVGQRFERLVVLERDFDYQKLKKAKRSYWKCQCDCGNIKTIASDSLKNGSTRSCGCLSRETTSKNSQKDLTNQRFGKLIALYPTSERTNSRHVIWYCKCDCGKDYKVSSSALLTGNTKSCGCLGVENLKNAWLQNQEDYDLIGQKFGKLTVISLTEQRKFGGRVWHCKCDCGNECDVLAQYLKRKSTQSCGCAGNSLGEFYIQSILEENNIKFEKEYIFQDFIYEDTKRHPRYDFYLPDYNRLIEFDGEQHYKYSNLGWNTKEKFELTKLHDQLKNNYAKEHNISLIRIPYWEKDNITLAMLLEDNYLIK